MKWLMRDAEWVERNAEAEKETEAEKDAEAETRAEVENEADAETRAEMENEAKADEDAAARCPVKDLLFTPSPPSFVGGVDGEEDKLEKGKDVVEKGNEGEEDNEGAEGDEREENDDDEGDDDEDGDDDDEEAGENGHVAAAAATKSPAMTHIEASLARRGVRVVRCATRRRNTIRVRRLADHDFSIDVKHYRDKTCPECAKVRKRAREWIAETSEAKRRRPSSSRIPQ